MLFTRLRIKLARIDRTKRITVFIQCFFRFWNVNVNVSWTFSTIFFPMRYCVPDRSATDSMSVFDRLRPYFDQKSSETLRNGQGRWTIGNLCKITFTVRSRSRFKIERNTVNINCIEIYKCNFFPNFLKQFCNLETLAKTTIT